MDEQEKAPSIGISLNVELPGKRALVLQSFIDRDCDPATLNGILDKLRVGAERQFAFGAIEQLRLQLEQEEKIAREHAERMAIVDENIQREWSNGNRRGEVRLTSKQLSDQQQSYRHAEECKRRIAKVKAEIAEFEAKIGA